MQGTEIMDPDLFYYSNFFRLFFLCMANVLSPCILTTFFRIRRGEELEMRQKWQQKSFFFEIFSFYQTEIADFTNISYKFQWECSNAEDMLELF